VSGEEKNLDDVRRFTENAARKYGWALIPDEEFYGYLIEGLLENYRRYGFFQCPCRDSYGQRAMDSDIACPCIYADADIREYGRCYCNLFLSPEAARNDPDPEQIPERRPAEYYP
jgi:ferredoxin-thioredoxin reductase catalytic subunit